MAAVAREISLSRGVIEPFQYERTNSFMSSGVFDDTYTAGIMNTRLYRLSHEDRKVLDTLATQLNDLKNRVKNRIFTEIGTVIDTTDT